MARSRLCPAIQKFPQEYADRIVYGTDMGTDRRMYRSHFAYLKQPMNTFTKEIFSIIIGRCKPESKRCSIKKNLLRQR